MSDEISQRPKYTYNDKCEISQRLKYTYDEKCQQSDEFPKDQNTLQQKVSNSLMKFPKDQNILTNNLKNVLSDEISQRPKYTYDCE